MNKFISYQDILINVDEIIYAIINPGTDELEVKMKNGELFIFDKDKAEDILISLKRITQAENQE